MTDWPVKTLGEICELVSRGRPPSYCEVGGVIVLNQKCVRNGQINFGPSRRTDDSSKLIPEWAYVREGDTLINSTGAGTLGRASFVSMLTEPTTFDTHLTVVRPRREICWPAFVGLVLNGREKDIIDLAGGATGQTELPREAVRTFEIPVPPLEEQKRIVTLLDAATARVTELTSCYEQARTHANDLLESSFLELFADAFESHPKRKMGEVLQIARGGSPRPISEYITKSSKGVNWIKIGDASSSTKYIYETAQKIKPEGVSRSRMVYPGDFLLSNSMSFGRPYIMKTEGCIHDGWLVLRDSKGELDQDFLFYLLGSRFMYERFSQLAAGSTVQNLNSALVSSVEIPVPPIDFQKRIAEKARLLEENVARLNEVNEIRLQRATDLRQSILEAAFAGDL